MTAARTACYVGIGSNIGDAQDHVQQALQRLDRLPHTQLSAQSSLFRTAPVDAAGDDYINAVARLDTQLEPVALLAGLQAIEQDFGRERPYRNAPRTLDLDLLLYGDAIIDSSALTVPHPRMAQRAFVLIPLMEIDASITIPGLGPAHAFVAGVGGQSIQKI
jgi:2-amino-4-hydroxy-6-hydroxymethyldihydropteridine diphosphokinase